MAQKSIASSIETLIWWHQPWLEKRIFKIFNMKALIRITYWNVGYRHILHLDLILFVSALGSVHKIRKIFFAISYHPTNCNTIIKNNILNNYFIISLTTLPSKNLLLPNLVKIKTWPEKSILEICSLLSRMAALFLFFDANNFLKMFKSQGMEKTQRVGLFFINLSIWKRTEIQLLTTPTYYWRNLWKLPC